MSGLRFRRTPHGPSSTSSTRRGSAPGSVHTAEILASYLEDHDPVPLLAAADRLNNGAVFKRLGYLIEQLDRGHVDLAAACHDRLTAGVSALDPTGPAGGQREPHWGLRVNATVSRDGAS